MSSNFIWRAPYPDTSLLLTTPQPDFGDGERPESRAEITRSMNGTVYTVISTRNAHTFRWTFVLTRNKAEEFLEVFKQFPATLWRVDRESWGDFLVGYLRINPFPIEHVRRGKIADSVDLVTLETEFETV